MARGGDELAGATATKVVRASGAGGAVANLTAAAALLLSGYSYYETVWKADALRVFVAPTIGFSDPSNGPFDVFAAPLTFANNGARAGVVLAIELEVTSRITGDTKRYVASGFGSWRNASAGEMAPFAPITVAGRETETREVLFWPRAEETIERHIDTEPGAYDFTLIVHRAAVERTPLDPTEPAPLSLDFEMTIDGLDYRAFNDGGTLPFRREDYRPVVSE